MVDKLKPLGKTKVIMIKTYDEMPIVGIRSDLAFVIKNLKTLFDIDTGRVRAWYGEEKCGVDLSIYQMLWQDPGTSNKRGPFWQYELKIFGEKWVKSL